MTFTIFSLPHILIMGSKRVFNFFFFSPFILSFLHLLICVYIVNVFDKYY
jgi:hypothetical protein